MAAIALSVIACQKSELSGPTSPVDEYTTEYTTSNTLTPVTDVVVSNPLNEWDFAGKQHNPMLDDYLQNKMLFDQTSFDQELVYNYFQVGSDVIDPIETMGEHKNSEVSELDGPALGAYQNNPAVFEYYFKLREIAQDQSADLIIKIARVKLLETTFDYSLVNADQAQVLKVSSSIARYSFYFWAPKDQGGLGNADDINNLHAASKKIDWWTVGQDDLWGAWTGALFTANPFTAIAGGVVSSAVGAGRQYFG